MLGRARVRLHRRDQPGVGVHVLDGVGRTQRQRALVQAAVAPAHDDLAGDGVVAAEGDARHVHGVEPQRRARHRRGRGRGRGGGWEGVEGGEEGDVGGLAQAGHVPVAQGAVGARSDEFQRRSAAREGHAVHLPPTVPATGGKQREMREKARYCR